MTSVPAPADERTALVFSQVNLNDLTPTPAEVMWAAERLADLPEVVELHANRAVRDWQLDGHVFRKAGHVALDLVRGRFTIWLYDGATTQDLNFYRQVIAAARTGLFLQASWRQFGAEEAERYINTLSWRLDSARLLGRATPIVRCSEPECDSAWHEGDEALHEAERTTGPGYAIKLLLLEGDPEWCVDVKMADDVELTPANAQRLAVDLQWVATTAAKLNAARAEAVAA